jgi:thiamine biosynthesis lipoprotein ApbE
MHAGKSNRKCRDLAKLWSRLVRQSVKILSLAAACSLSSIAQPTLQRFHQTHAAMGTIFTIDINATDQATAEQDMDLAFDEVDRLEALLSNYRPSSELSRISREAGSAPVVTDPETFHFLERSFYWSRVSDGAFDITVGPLLRAWGFFFHQGRVPSQAELNALREKVGWKNVALDAQTRTVSFINHQAMELDPGSIGKGFAVDAVVKLLREQGVTSAFISAGGSTLYAIGTVPGTAGWPVDIPDNPEKSPHPSCSKTPRSPPAPAPRSSSSKTAIATVTSSIRVLCGPSKACCRPPLSTQAPPTAMRSLP